MIGARAASSMSGLDYLRAIAGEYAATLGEKVVLPPFLEAHRQRIVSNLTPID